MVAFITCAIDLDSSAGYRIEIMDTSKHETSNFWYRSDRTRACDRLIPIPGTPGIFVVGLILSKKTFPLKWATIDIVST